MAAIRRTLALTPEDWQRLDAMAKAAGCQGWHEFVRKLAQGTIAQGTLHSDRTRPGVGVPPAKRGVTHAPPAREAREPLFGGPLKRPKG